MNTVAVIDYGMGNLHSVAKALEHSSASARVLEKVGLRLEGCRRDHLYHRGRFEDVFEYGVVVEDLRASSHNKVEGSEGS